MSPGGRPLRATYRLQLTPDFGFADARRLIPYLRDLGVSHLYLSPSLRARRGSTHGYDVIDPTTVSPELGGEDALRALAAEAHGAGLGIVLDVVPNHMAAEPDNPFWSDPALRERFFDIDAVTGRHRRFFDIDDLAGVRQEDPEVFARTHAKVLELVGDGTVDGLRIDHPDGLADPAGYLARLREAGVASVWVEKILESDEHLRDWPVSGTVGYEFLNDACAVFVDPAAEPALTELWRQLSGDARPFAEVSLQAKREQAAGTFAPEIERLARTLGPDAGKVLPRDAAEGSPHPNNTPASTLADAVASFPVYRSYIRPGQPPADADRAAIAAAHMDGEVAAMLLGERAAPEEFVVRFQQTTPAVIAKGVEDTAFYRYCRLLALCDVGGDPGRFGIGVARLHEANAERAQRFPEGMLTTTTHDTKRTADVRARIAALTWMADEWRAQVREFDELTARLRSGGAPDGVERYLLWQTLVGAWPIELERVQEYMVKALREAKRNTAWVDGDPAWEDAVTAFCAALYEHREFRAALERFTARVAALGDRIALGMLVLKLTCPGVPDIYQGDELALHALVDPDNRRPVDWPWHEAMLAKLQGGAPVSAMSRKLWTCVQLLALRIRRPHCFDAADPRGAYRPLDAGDDTVCFTRGDNVAVAVAVRRRIGAGTLPALGGDWQDVLSGEPVALDTPVAAASLLGAHGVAVLERT